MPDCGANKANGEPCTAKAAAGTDPPRCRRHPIDPRDRTGHEKRQAFLEAYALVGNVSDAAAHAQTTRQKHYEWLDEPSYAEAFHHAKEQAADRLEREAVRRATAGVEVGVWHKGERVGTERKYSDVLLIFLLKGLRPEKYRDSWTAADAPTSDPAPVKDIVLTEAREQVKLRAVPKVA